MQLDPLIAVRFDQVTKADSICTYELTYDLVVDVLLREAVDYAASFFE
jgi:hypothetical protein